MSLTIEGMSDGYVRLIEAIAGNGHSTSPRGQETIEVIGAQFTLRDPLDNLPTHTGRKLNVKIAIAEAMQLIAGRSYPELMVEIAPNFRNFTDGGTWFHGAYGPRLMRQIPTLLRTIANDPDTRQALATIWDPQYDGYADVRDTPCTIAMQFFQRSGQLEMVLTMRSNDIYWGVPYDVFQFTTLQIQLAHCLGLDAGPYHHQAGSLHIYTRDAAALSQVHAAPHPTHPLDQRISIRPEWNVIRDVARAILDGESHFAMSAYGQDLTERLHAAA